MFAITNLAPKSLLLPPATTAITEVTAAVQDKFKKPANAVKIDAPCAQGDLNGICFYLCPLTVSEKMVEEAVAKKKDPPLLAHFWTVRRTKKERESNCVFVSMNVAVKAQISNVTFIDHEGFSFDNMSSLKVAIPIILNKDAIVAGQELIVYDPETGKP